MVARAPRATAPSAAPGTVATLRHAHLRILRRPPDTIERAALSKCCALKQASKRPSLRDAGAEDIESWRSSAMVARRTLGAKIFALDLPAVKY